MTPGLTDSITEGGPGAARQKRRSLNAEISAERLAVTAAKRKQAEMLLAKARGELILRDLVERQAEYLLTAMRQRILALPGAYAGRLVGCADVAASGEILREAALALLDDLKDFPERVVDPSWLERIGEEGVDPK
jgi:hypothetical protein